MENVKAVAGGSLLLSGPDVQPLPMLGAALPPPTGATPSAAAEPGRRAAPAARHPMPSPGVAAGTAAPGSVTTTPQPAVPTDSTPGSVLDDLVCQFHEASGAILASVDGFAIAQSSSMGDEASHSAMLAAAVGLSHQIVSMSGGRQLRQLVVEHDRGLLLAWPIGSQRVLAVLAQHTIEQRRLHSFVHARTDVLIGGGS